MNYPLVYIIVLNWNGLHNTMECLESLTKLDYPNYKVLVVDNGSTDGSQEIILRRHSEIILIENKENLGYAKGNNTGIKFALKNNADYVWLLNNDTVVDPHALVSMIIVAEKDPKIGIIGSKIYYFGESKKIWFAGAQIDWWKGISKHIGMNEIDVGKYNYVKEVDRVIGCSMLVKKEVCKQVGLFDENYFIYVEEVDLCVRARKYGFKCLIVPSSIVYHKGGVSVSKIGNWEKVFNYYNTRNFLYLIKKSFNFPIREIILLSVIIRKLKDERINILKILFYKVRYLNKIKPYEFPVLFGIKDFLTKKMGKANYRFE
jgi:GT2 family glycosyltransferase